MRINEAAKILGVSTSTVRKYSNQGMIPHARNVAGQRVYTFEDLKAFMGEELPVSTKIAFYIRSSSGNKDLMDAQVTELTKAYGEPTAIYRDRASGLNEKRPGLLMMLKHAGNKEWGTVAVTYEDRLSRFGITYLRMFLERSGVTLAILNESKKSSVEEELIADFMSLISSFSGRFYRLRSRDNSLKLLDKARGELSA